MKKFTLLILVALAFATNTRADVEWTIWEGEKVYASWGDRLTIDGNLINSLEAGDILYGEVKDIITEVNSATVYPQVGYYLQLKDDPWTSDQGVNIASFSSSSTSFSLEITSDLISNCATKNLNLNGVYYTLTKLSVKKKKSAIKKDFGINAFSTGNNETGKTVDKGLFANATANDYVVISGSQTNDKSNYQWGLTANSNAWYKWIASLGGGWIKLSAEDVTTIQAYDGWLCGYNMDFSGMYLYHPIESFSIGIIGYATFSASQQVTAPASVTAYKGEVSGDKLVLTPFTDNVIPANTGAIIKGDEGAVLEFLASNESTSETSDLIACTSATDVTTLAESGYDLYVLYPGTGESETDILSTLLSGIDNWGGNVTVSTTEPYTAEWTNNSTSSSMGKWLGLDWSSYDKLRLVFTSNTVTETVHFGLSYKDQSDSENTGADLATGKLTVDIPLNESYKGAMGNFSFNSNATSGSLTFESAALIDNDGATVAEFHKTTSGTLAANKAYLKIASDSNNARALRIVFGGDITEINSVEEKKPVTIDNNIIYNLNGQVVKNPSRGIYIKNGKKFIVE